MKCAAILFAFLAAIAGFIAAWRYKSAFEKPPKMDALNNFVRDPRTGLTPVDQWLLDCGYKNKLAAGWTAIALFFGAIRNIPGAL